MTSKYVHITQNEFEEIMKENFFICTNPNERYQEFIYQYSWHDDSYTLKIYSSITAQGGSRKRGADAIRIILLVKTQTGMRPMWKSPRVYRTTNWRNKIQKRIDEALLRGCDGRDYECPKCGAPIILRESKHGSFWGCSSWMDTRCSYTQSHWNK